MYPHTWIFDFFFDKFTATFLEINREHVFIIILYSFYTQIGKYSWQENNKN